MATLKRKTLTVDEKVSIIREIENGKKKADICQELSLVNSTVCTIWKDRDKIITAFEKNITKNKRLRKPAREDIDEALFKWFVQQRSANVPLSGPLLKVKAEEFAKLFGDEQFICSNGWIDRFKVRHNITFGKISGEARDVNREETDEWLNSVWPKIREGYNDNDIFNGDETGLFFKLTPDRTLKFKGEKCVGGKLSKDRITLFVCANMKGQEKRKLLVIGKSKSPRCFKNIKTMPVQYCANKKAWMTSNLFETELRQWDRELRIKSRKIILLVDNCPAHPKIENLKNIKLVFLPPNTTSVLQPMDQGVIQSLKCHYRKLILLKMIENIEKKKDHSINLLDAIRNVATAWRRVTEQTIRNCFCHAGFKSLQPEANEGVTNDEDDLPLAEWLRAKNVNDFEQYQDLNAYTSIDDEVITTEAQSDLDIVRQVNSEFKKTSDEEEEDEEDLTEETVPSVREALQAIKVISRFYEGNEADLKIMSNISQLEDNLEKHYWSSRKTQKKITDFFN